MAARTPGSSGGSVQTLPNRDLTESQQARISLLMREQGLKYPEAYLVVKSDEVAENLSEQGLDKEIKRLTHSGIDLGIVDKVIELAIEKRERQLKEAACVPPPVLPRPGFPFAPAVELWSVEDRIASEKELAIIEDTEKQVQEELERECDNRHAQYLEEGAVAAETSIATLREAAWRFFFLEFRCTADGKLSLQQRAEKISFAVERGAVTRGRIVEERTFALGWAFLKKRFDETGERKLFNDPEGDAFLGSLPLPVEPDLKVSVCALLILCKIEWEKRKANR